MPNVLLFRSTNNYEIVTVDRLESEIVLPRRKEPLLEPITDFPQPPPCFEDKFERFYLADAKSGWYLSEDFKKGESVVR